MLASFLAVAASVLAGCDAWNVEFVLPATREVRLRPDCSIAIADLAAVTTTLEEGQPLPPDTVIVVADADFDGRATLGTDDVERPSITLHLVPASAEQFAEYTGTHIGELVAVALNGRVVVAPVIQAPIEDGAITLPAGPFGDCVAD